jgi:hypothetical protein
MSRFVITLWIMSALIVGIAGAAARDSRLPPLQTNESYVQAVTATTHMAINDPMSVFAYVLDSLPARVKVYPTENHYYFSFLVDGIRYAGNIKIDAYLRAKGKVAFAYYEERPVWLKDTSGTSLVLGPSQGVTVEKIDPMAYKLTYKSKNVVFVLNDLSQVKPPSAALTPDEQFIGPVFDESGVRFFLVFDRKLKLFHYILDETIRPTDIFVPAPVGEGRILIGKRTGFAVYRDQRRDRKILIGVYQGNVDANNYLDGPFDQMPDNFIKDDAFRQAILAVEPDLKGQINRYATFSDGARLAIEPYMEYRKPKDLKIFDRCATNPRLPGALYEACFSLPLEGNHKPEAQPLAMLR